MPRSKWVWLPIIAFLVEHPDRGTVLIDTAFADEVRTDPAKNLGKAGAKLFAPILFSPEGTVTEQLRERGIDPGDVQPLSRRTPDGALLEWRLTRGQERRLELPFLIDWGTTPQPGVGDLPTVELVDFVRTEVDPAPIAALDAWLTSGTPRPAPVPQPGSDSAQRYLALFDTLVSPRPSRPRGPTGARARS